MLPILILHHRYRVFSYSGIFSSTGKLPQQQVWTRPQQPTAGTQWERFPLRATDATMLVLLRNCSNTSFIPGSSQTSTTFSNFCGHVNVTQSTEDLKSIWSKPQVPMAWIHKEWMGKGKVVKMWKVLFWRLHSSEIGIKAILQIKSAMRSATACPLIYESKRRLY